MNRMPILVAAASLVIVGAMFTSQATAKKSVTMECSAFEVPVTRKGQQKRGKFQTRVVPEGWTVVGGGYGVSPEGGVALGPGTVVMACREYVPGVEAE